MYLGWKKGLGLSSSDTEPTAWLIRLTNFKVKDVVGAHRLPAILVKVLGVD